jgi:hypothetical protein
MKITINLHQFRDAFRNSDRINQFSYEGLEALFNYLEDYEEGTGEELELDVIGLCCDFYEISFEDFAEEYGIEQEDMEDLEGDPMGYVQDNLPDVADSIIGATHNSFIMRNE